MAKAMNQAEKPMDAAEKKLIETLERARQNLADAIEREAARKDLSYAASAQIEILAKSLVLVFTLRLPGERLVDES